MNAITLHPEKEGVTFLEIKGDTGVVRAEITIHLPRISKLSYILPPVFADMLTRGSRKYSKAAYTEKLEYIGAQVSITADYPYVTIEITSREEKIGEVLMIVKDALQNPLFLPLEIQKIKKEYEQLLHEKKDDARGIAYGVFIREIYGKEEESYIPTIEEQKRGLTTITHKDLQELHAKILRSKWTVSVAGSRKTQALFSTFVANVHKGLQFEPQTSLKGKIVSTKKIYTFVPEKQNVEFFIGNRLPLTLKDADFLSFSFGLDILGKRGGFSGRLMSTVREKEGLTYSIYAWTRDATTERMGHWNIFTFFTAKDTPQGLSSTAREVRKIVNEGVTEVEVKRYKELLINQFRLAHGSTHSLLSLYHTGLVSGRTPEEIEGYPNRIDALTRKGVNHALRTYLKPDMLIISGAGPTKEIVEKN